MPMLSTLCITGKLDQISEVKSRFSTRILAGWNHSRKNVKYPKPREGGIIILIVKTAYWLDDQLFSEIFP